jgi:arylsulfatase A-like enzyme
VAKYEKLYEQGWDITREKRYQKMMKLGVIDKRHVLTERPNDIPAWIDAKDKKNWVRKMAVYAAMIDRMDQNIGKLISTLKANGQFENTLIVFLSDNGGCAENMDSRHFNDTTKKIGERGSYVTYDIPWANVSNTPYKKYKKYLHEGGMITPCIMHWPVKIKHVDGFLTQTGHVIDLLPTALEIAGAKPESFAGESLSYFWNGKTANTQTYFWEHEGNQAIRKGNWKMVKDMEDPAWELYDLDKDPTEVHDLAKTNPQKVKSMSDEYTAWAKNVGVKGSKNTNKSE